MSLSKCEVKNSLRKKVSNPELWLDKKLKLLRNSGAEYTNKRGKGRLIPAKDPPISARGCAVQNCTKDGCHELSLDRALQLFNTFYALSYNEQNMLLFKCLRIKEPTTRRQNKTDANSRKLASFEFIVDDMRVCAPTLKNIFQIGKNRLETVQKKMKDGHLVPKDRRGSHMNRPRMLSFADRNTIKDHIGSFPIMENHYSRKDSRKNCLSMDLSVKKMYCMFKQDHPECRVNYCFYRKVFNRDFNLRFGSPRSDTCKTCDENYAKLVLARDAESRQVILNESQIHHMKADNAYKELAENSKNLNFVTLCVDLQVLFLFTPTFTHLNIYYQR